MLATMSGLTSDRYQGELRSNRRHKSPAGAFLSARSRHGTVVQATFGFASVNPTVTRVCHAPETSPCRTPSVQDRLDRLHAAIATPSSGGIETTASRIGATGRSHRRS